jgi:hypothetical protein
MCDDVEWPRAEFFAETTFVESGEASPVAHLLFVGDERVLAVSLSFSVLETLRDRIDGLLADAL